MNLYEFDWDLLVVVDACRPEWMHVVENEFEFLNDVGKIWSVGSSSGQWMENTFSESFRDEISNTIYVCANPHATEYAPIGQFKKFEAVYQYGTDDQLSTVPAHEVTDAAVTLGRKFTPDRMILHYMQPHQPFLQCGNNRYSVSQSAEFKEFLGHYTKMMGGDISQETLKQYYRDNLRYVLNEVSLLLENVNAETVCITSDHGNCFGERFLYNHPSVNIAPLREVPIVWTSAEDQETLIPRSRERTDGEDVESLLESLGYM